MILRAAILYFSLVFLNGNTAPIEIAGKVENVVDGNTIQFLSTDNESFKFILSGIDCPELNQEFGNEAKEFLENLLKGKMVILIIGSKDRFGNQVGSLKLSEGQDPRIDLLKKGLAWTQEKNPNREFENIKDDAKGKRIGLWSQVNPTAPWTYRRQQSMISPKTG